MNRWLLLAAWLLSASACSKEIPSQARTEIECDSLFQSLATESERRPEADRLASADALPVDCRVYSSYKLARAKSLVLNGRRDEASALLLTVNAKSRVQATELARIRLGIAYLSGDEETEKVSRNVVAQMPDSFIGYSGLARAAAGRHDYARAISYVERGEALVRPGEEEIAARAFVVLSIAYYNSKNPTEALRLVESGLQYDQSFLKDPKLATVAIVSATDVGDFQKARAFLGLYFEFNNQGGKAEVQEAIDYLRTRMPSSEHQSTKA